LVVSGFFFSDSDSDEDVVRIKGENNRLTESAIIAPRRGGKWIHFLQPGRHNRVDHCYVEGHAPQDVRLQAWARLATDLDLGKLARATQVVGLAGVPGLAGPVLQGQVRGRTVVDVNA